MLNQIRRLFGHREQERQRPPVPVLQGGDEELERLVRQHHQRQNPHQSIADKGEKQLRNKQGEGRAMYRGGKVKGTPEDDEAEFDTIDAKLQSNEVVLPRVYAKLGLDMLKKKHLPLPIPAKVEKVMHEFKHHKLHDSHGKLITNRKQAIAVALDVARREGLKHKK
jgi:hypothetical protein